MEKSSIFGDIEYIMNNTLENDKLKKINPMYSIKTLCEKILKRTPMTTNQVTALPNKLFMKLIGHEEPEVVVQETTDQMKMPEKTYSKKKGYTKKTKKPKDSEKSLLNKRNPEGIQNFDNSKKSKVEKSYKKKKVA